MDSNDTQQLTLAIESAIAGGSISLLSDGREIDACVGADKVSRAEDLLPNIIAMLERQSLERSMVRRIAVSLGPGSFTGIRIGIATALGLKDSLRIPCVGISALEAMAMSTSLRGSLIAAVPVGRDLICSQSFDLGQDGKPRPTVEPYVGRSIPDQLLKRETVIVVHEAIFEFLQKAVPTLNVQNAGSNLARLVGIAAMGRTASNVLEPIFVSPAV